MMGDDFGLTDEDREIMATLAAPAETYPCGHPRTPENTVGQKKHRCKTCHYAYSAAYVRPERTPDSPRRTITKRSQPGPDGCIIWTGALDTDGYPKICCGSNGSKIRYAHRINWELTRGPIPDGLHLSRRLACMNRRCIAPEHLELLPVGAAGGRIATTLKPTYRCGHDKTPENTLDAETKPCCRTCRTEYLRKYNALRPNRNSGKKIPV